jgi:hypothetical protein
MCNSSEFKLCTCLARDLKPEDPQWTIYSVIEEPLLSIKVGVISSVINYGTFNFKEFEKLVKDGLVKSNLFDFDYRPQHMDLVLVSIPRLNYKVVFQYWIYTNTESKWRNLRFSLDSIDDFKTSKVISGVVKFL